MLTHHSIAAISVMIHDEITKLGPQIDGTALDDVSIHEITQMDPHSNLSPWEVHGRLIISIGVGFQWRGIKSRYSFVTDTQPKSLNVEIFANLMDEKKKGHEPCHTSPSVMVEDSVHCWEYDILGKYVTEVPIPSSITEPMTSSTNFPDEVHLSIHRFHGNLIMERVQFDKSHQFPLT